MIDAVRGSPPDLALEVLPLDVTLVDAQGQPASAQVTVGCFEDTWEHPGAESLATAAVAGTQRFWVPRPAQCTADASYDDMNRVEHVDVGDQPAAVELLLDSVEITGDLDLPDVGSDVVTIRAYAEGQQAGWVDVAPDAESYSLRVPSSNRIALAVSAESYAPWQSLSLGATLLGVTAPTVHDFAVATGALRVHVEDAAGPVSSPVSLACTDWTTRTRLTTAADLAPATLEGLPSAGTTDRACDVVVHGVDGDGNTMQRFRAPVDVGSPGPGEVTVFLETGFVIHGDPATAVDDDGVSAEVESFGPHQGDGNRDGVYDYRQSHVTSLPANGAPPGGSVAYITLAAPDGTGLADVSTVDAATLPPTPEGVEIPDGVISFVLTGVPPGSDQQVEIYSPNAGWLTDYAKYDADSGQWSLLPRSRVVSHTDHITVTLTDGGVGDADGVADGRIVDPGALALADAPSDTTPPTVTGAASAPPNGQGWYAGDVTVEWTATDDTSAVVAPPDTVLTGEGADLSATSEEVCDDAGNCATATVDGIRIDRTPPSVSVTGPTDGASYTLGSAPAPGCTASDTLSGLDGDCAVEETGGQTNGVGSFDADARAVDRAGNDATQRVTYDVLYRFPGFRQPINDPRLNPRAPMSVFRAGSTVPVSFTLRRADGRLVAPTAAPRWVTPVRGASTKARVNESASFQRGSSGNVFTWRKGRWQFDWSTRGVPAGFEYRIGAALDDGSTRWVTVALG